MTTRIKQEGRIDDSKVCLPISKGGTASSKKVDAARNLKLITNAMKNLPNGPIGIDSNGLISPTVLPAGLSFDSSINVTGPLSLSINQVQAYTITDYDINTTYTLAAIGGSISRSGATITYTAPGVTGAGGFTINGKTFVIAIGSTLPNTPSITSPSTGSTNLLSSVNFTANAFSMLSGTDTHEGSDWQIATDAGFTSIVSQVTNDSTNKTSWTVTTLAPSTTYYARVRYKGAIYGYSAWSSAINFTTKLIFTPTTEEAVIIGTPRAVDDQFGWSIKSDSSGIRVAVGAISTKWTSNPSVISGSVYIFRKSGDSWIQEAVLQPTSGDSTSSFGSSIGMNSDGSVLVVGESTAAASGVTACGVIHVYNRVGTTWTREIILTASDKASNDLFGCSVDISSDGTRIVVGAFGSRPESLVQAGAAYVFSKLGGSWIIEQKILPTISITGHRFGRSVAMDDSANRIVIGGAGGYVYVFLRTGTVWAQEAKVGDDVTSNVTFVYGTSVDIDGTGTRIAASAPSYNSGSGTFGAVMIHKRTGTSWALESTLLSGETTDRMGSEVHSVSMSSDGAMVAVGNIYMTVSGIVQAGAVFVFSRSGVAWNKTIRLNQSSLVANDNFGYSVAVSSDGSKVFVGAINKSVSSIKSGSSHIFI